MYLRRRLKVKQEGERRNIFLRYLGEVATAVSDINGADRKKLYEQLLAVAKKKTAEADMKLDDRGKVIEEPTRSSWKRIRNVLIVRTSRNEFGNSQTMAKQSNGQEELVRHGQGNDAATAMHKRPQSNSRDRDKKTLERSGRPGRPDRASTPQKKRDPHLDIPAAHAVERQATTRPSGFSRWASNTNRRQLFNLSQAKGYMQTMLVASGCKQLIDAGQDDQPPRSVLHAQAHDRRHQGRNLRRSGRVRHDHRRRRSDARTACAKSCTCTPRTAATMVGPITLDRQRRRDRLLADGLRRLQHSLDRRARRRSQFKKCTAKFILHVEKDTVWQRFNEDKFWQKHNCILTHGGGQPPRGVRRMLHRLHNELKLPVYCLLDNDPWGYYIYSVIKQGSINLAYESQRMAIPDAKFLGLRSQRLTNAASSRTA